MKTIIKIFGLLLILLMVSCSKESITPIQKSGSALKESLNGTANVPQAIVGSRTIKQIRDTLGDILEKELIKMSRYDSVPVTSIYIESMKVYDLGDNNEGYSLKVSSNRPSLGTVGFVLPVYPRTDSQVTIHYCSGCWYWGGCDGYWNPNGNGNGNYLQCFCGTDPNSGCSIKSSIYVFNNDK